MEEKELKTSLKQRIFIGIIAVLMLGSMIAGYALMVVGGNSNADSNDSQISEEKIAQYQNEYNEIVAKFKEATKSDYDHFLVYKNDTVKEYNEAAANEGDVAIKDLETGTGAVLTSDNYLAYYIGWCADGKIFDSSFDNGDEPTSFVSVLDPSGSMIQGWTKGVEGMKIGGIRRITIPSEYGYGEGGESVCGANKPLRFLVMPVAKEEPLSSMAEELNTANMRLQYANYGIDYDEMMSKQE